MTSGGPAQVWNPRHQQHVEDPQEHHLAVSGPEIGGSHGRHRSACRGHQGVVRRRVLILLVPADLWSGRTHIPETGSRVGWSAVDRELRRAVLRMPLPQEPVQVRSYRPLGGLLEAGERRIVEDPVHMQRFIGSLEQRRQEEERHQQREPCNGYPPDRWRRTWELTHCVISRKGCVLGHLRSDSCGCHIGSISVRRGLVRSRSERTGSPSRPQSAPMSGSSQATPSSSAGL